MRPYSLFTRPYAPECAEHRHHDSYRCICQSEWSFPRQRQSDSYPSPICSAADGFLATYANAEYKMFQSLSSKDKKRGQGMTKIKRTNTHSERLK